MKQHIKMAGALVSIVETDFRCPACTKAHTEEDWYPRLCKSKDFVIYMRCKGCKTKLGVSADIMGDVVVWLKSEEKEVIH